MYFNLMIVLIVVNNFFIILCVYNIVLKFYLLLFDMIFFELFIILC